MRWREARTLWRMEWRELAASRPFALVMAAAGLLVGQAFATATRAYAEVSGSAGGAAALAQGVSPLDGLIVPTFGAYALVATLLLPFAAIRSLGADKETGALRLLVQSPVSRGTIIGVKALVACCAWLLTWTPGLLALLWWRSIGGHLDAAEVTVVLLGHLLHGALVIALAIAAAAMTRNAASAAVVTLAATLGGWALDFVAQVRGGLWQRLAVLTPDAALRTFEHGELRAGLVISTLLLAIILLAAAAVAIDPALPRASRWRRGVIIALVALETLAAVPDIRASADLSEDRRNSFSRADAAALGRIRAPLRITAHLAPEDPRLIDLQRGVFHKLQRTMPDVQVEITARTGTGLFERPDAAYGEVWYDVAGRREMSRSTTEPIVLETIYRLAQITPPTAMDEATYSGYPLKIEPSGIALVFYFLWPVTILGAAAWLRRRMAGITTSPASPR